MPIIDPPASASRACRVRPNRDVQPRARLGRHSLPHIGSRRNSCPFCTNIRADRSPAGSTARPSLRLKEREVEIRDRDLGDWHRRSVSAASTWTSQHAEFAGPIVDSAPPRPAEFVVIRVRNACLYRITARSGYSRPRHGEIRCHDARTRGNDDVEQLEVDQCFLAHASTSRREGRRQGLTPPRARKLDFVVGRQDRQPILPTSDSPESARC